MFQKSFRAMAMFTILMSPVACGTTGPDSPGIFGGSSSNIPMTPAEARLRDDNRIFNETILGGAASGAITGAIFGALLGLATGKSKNIVAGAAIGAAAGGAMGALDGWRVAKKQEASRKQIREIDLITDEIEAENRKIAQSIRNVDVVISDTQRSLRGARIGYRSGLVSLDEMRQKEARAENNIKVIDELIDNLDERNREYRQVAEQLSKEGENTARMDRELKQTEILLAEAKRERDLLEDELVQGRIG